MRRFTLIRDDLSTASEDENSDISINTSVLFESKAEKYSNVLGEINHVTKRPKYPGYTLVSCRFDVDTLSSVISNNRNNRSSSFHNCKLENKYIGADSSIIHHSDFEKVVVKLQDRKSASLIIGEENSVKHLLSVEQLGTSESDTATPMTMKKALEKRRKMQADDSGFINCEFVPG